MSFKRLWITACAVLASALAIMPALPVRAEEAEATSETLTRIELTGQLIELSSTDLPTTVVLRVNPTGTFKDYTVEVPAGAQVKPAMDTWITGDSLRVEGTLNDNTGVVTAKAIGDASLKNDKQGMNGWVKAIGATTMTVTWQNKDTVLSVTDKTHLVIPPKNPAALADFKVGDRVRVRLVEGTTTNEASIIVALRRGDDIFLKARTRPFSATLNAVDEGSKTLTVTLKADAKLKSDDVNNLVGVGGEIVTVSYDDKTNFVRRFKGSASADELTPGDTLFIVGRVNDDGTITARMVRDDSMFKAGVARHLGEITSIDTSANSIKVKFVPMAAGMMDMHDMPGMHMQMEGRDGLSIELKARIEAGMDWTVTYTDSTEIWRDGKKAAEGDLKVGDVIRVEGVANTNTKTVAATRIAAHASDFHPLLRERPLKDIVKERIETSLGKRHADDIVKEQEPVDAE